MNTTEANIDTADNALYIIGQKSPEGATHESEITHYQVAKNLEDAKAGVGIMMERNQFVKMIADKPYIKVKAYNKKNGRIWDLKISIS